MANLNGANLTLSVETKGSPFIEGDAYTDSTHIVAYAESSQISLRVGGYNVNTYTRAVDTRISAVKYYIGTSASGSVDGYFRIKIENGTKATAWSQSEKDTNAAINAAKDAADSAQSTALATKTSAVARTQRIYYRTDTPLSSSNNITGPTI